MKQALQVYYLCRTIWRSTINISKTNLGMNPHMHEIFSQRYCSEMGPRGPTKENAQLNRQNDLSFTQIELKHCLTRKKLCCTVWFRTVWFRKFVYFIRKRHHTAKIALRWVPGKSSTKFLVTSFTQKTQKKAQIPCSPPSSC